MSKVRSSGVVVLGAGAAGDIVSAYVFCELLRRIFGVGRCVPAAILWERWVLDPYPGPIPRNALKGARISKCVYVSSRTRVVRDDYMFRPQASVISELYGSEIPAFTLDEGVEGMVKCVEELRSLGYKYLIALDVGGDILARGYEEDLWSPLADSMSLALADIVGDSLVAVLAPGADGELSHDYVLRRIQEIGARGGLYGALGITRDVLDIYEEVLKITHTEAGRAPYLALRGVMGDVQIRGGSRKITITPNSVVIYLLEPSKVIEENELAKNIRSTTSLTEALKTAEKLSILTELHLELEIAKTYGCGPRTTKIIDWNLIKRRVRQKIKPEPKS